MNAELIWLAVAVLQVIVAALNWRNARTNSRMAEKIATPSDDYLRGYRHALDHAAFYVNDHCRSGEYHAEIIRELKPQ